MDSKEKLRIMLSDIETRTGKKPADISIELGYRKNGISDMLAPKGIVSPKFLDKLRLKYFGKSDFNLSMDEEFPAAYGGMTIPEQIAFLKRHADFLEFEIMARLKLQDEILKRIDVNSEIAAKSSQDIQSRIVSRPESESTGESPKPGRRKVDLSNPTWSKNLSDKENSGQGKRAKAGKA